MAGWKFILIKTARLRRDVAALGGQQWLAIGIHVATIICLGIFTWLVVQTALDKETEFWGKLFLLTLGVLGVLAGVLLAWKRPNQRLVDYLLSLKGAATICASTLSAFGIITGALTLFEPRPATTADLQAIFDKRFPDSSLKVAELNGRWGEQDPECGLVWDIRIVQSGNDLALAADMVVRPEGVAPYRFLGSLYEGRGNVLAVIGEEPASARGFGAEFRYNGATQRLVWDDKRSNGGAEEYRRCP